MKYGDIKDFSDQQLQDRVNEETQTLTKLRFAHAVSSVENPMKIRITRRIIAQLKTEVSRRSLTNSSAVK